MRTLNWVKQVWESTFGDQLVAYPQIEIDHDLFFKFSRVSFQQDIAKSSVFRGAIYGFGEDARRRVYQLPNEVLLNFVREVMTIKDGKCFKCIIAVRSSDTGVEYHALAYFTCEVWVNILTSWDAVEELISKAEFHYEQQHSDLSQFKSFIDTVVEHLNLHNKQ